VRGLDGHGGPITQGARANLVAFDPNATWIVEPASLASKSRNTPYAGRKLSGRVVHTIFNGRSTIRDGSDVDGER
ncbi:MAG: dihydroorotase, partial [Actinobacteria bacterium]|nr:dihydroorotase [Actinomycetota bacterium]